MKPKWSPPVHGLRAPAPRLTGAALLLVALGLSTAFMVMAMGFSLGTILF